MFHDVDSVAQYSADARTPVESTQFRHHHNVGPVAAIAFIAYLAITIGYFAYRLPLWNPAAPIISTLMLVAELFGVMTLLLHVFSTWTLVERRAPTPPAGYEADILITTWNESVDILRNTLLAAKQVRLVKDIWLLDDGCRPEMEALARELGTRYIARSDRSHAKAGNLNNALQYTEAEFVAILDCDHAPSPEFLERTLGYFVDPKVGFVQTPQDFYNTGSFQHRGSARTKEAWHEQTLFYRVIQPGKDRWNAGFFCGSCAVMRKATLEDIGGVATGTITEDMHTSLRIHKRGWSSVYHSEALAFGLSPATLDQYDTQRLRWGRGAMQVWLKEGILFRGNLTLAQRLAYFMSTITYFEGWQKAIVYFLPMAVILTGSMPIIWAGWPFIGIFLAWFTAGVIVNELFSRGYAKTIWTEEYNFFRFFTFMKATLALVIPIKWRFSVTPKGLDMQGSLWLRLWPQFVMAIGVIGSITAGTLIYLTQHHLPEGAFISNLVWLTVNGAIAVKALSFASGRRHQKRTEHRFPLPMIAQVRVGDSDDVPSSMAIAYDVSSRGMSLRTARHAALGPILHGQLSLPSGPVPFRGRVQRTDISGDGKEVVLGLSFEWLKDSDADPLNSCLYGNTLQWDVNSWSEVKRFRLSHLWNHSGEADASEWHVGHLRSENGHLRCLVRQEGENFRLLSFEPLPQAANFRLRVNGRSEEGLQLEAYREYSVGGGRVCLALLHERPQAITKFHREPKWMRTAGALA
ncbi:glycosyltransferase [Aquisediminimonas sediminicola]|uniref:glycosyltransferase n=1 Tax=Alteraquisediminimonas sediminicola TaxID=2676787 RepID=UPI001C8DD236